MLDDNFIYLPANICIILNYEIVQLFLYQFYIHLPELQDRPIVTRLFLPSFSIRTDISTVKFDIPWKD